MSVAPWIDGSACPNCGTARTGTYCSSCGQKAMPLAPTLGYFVHELIHELVHVDGKIFRSVRLLVTRPGFLTREIFAGRRASYISPLRLYLVASILSFALAASFGGLDEGVDFERAPNAAESADPARVERLAEADSPIPYVATATDFVTEIYMVGYFFLAFRRVYETTVWGTLWRAVSIGLLYLAVLLIALVAIAAPAWLALFLGQAP